MMSKNKKKQKKKEEQPVVNVTGEVFPCKQVYLQLLSKDLRLESLNKVMLQHYLKNSCINRVVKEGDIFSLQVYGRDEPFQVTKCLALPGQEDLKEPEEGPP